MADFYEEDLAYIHDTGYTEFALKSAPGILNILHRSKIREGLIYCARDEMTVLSRDTIGSAPAVSFSLYLKMP
ncbi:MAG: hypothetical protein L0229_08875, partial [Blastocatellia bacterium]|nr:hypothetical protein [Blastocatellia bacterium]